MTIGFGKLGFGKIEFALPRLAVKRLCVMALIISAASVARAAVPPPAPSMLPVAADGNLVLIFGSPRSGQQAGFDAWFAKHPGEFMQVPGMRSAQAFALHRTGAQSDGLPGYLAMYDVAQSAMAGMNGEVGKRIKDGRISTSTAEDSKSVIVLHYRPIGNMLLAQDVPGSVPPMAGSGPLLDYEFVVFTKPVPGQDAVFNNWYDHQHMPDVLRVPGFVAAQRFVETFASPSGASIPRYLIVFTLRSRDIDATNAEIGRRMQQHITILSPAFDMKSGKGAFLLPLAPVAFASPANP